MKSPPASLLSRERLNTILASPLLPLVLVLGIALVGRFQPFDDAYITYRYARNISSGLGFVYNAGEQVLGTTSPLFTLLLAGAAALFGPEYIPDFALWFSTLSEVAAVILIFRVGRWIFQSTSSALAVSTAYALHPFRASVMLGGMESSLFVALVFLTYMLLLVENRPRLASLAAALAFLTRPEALLALGPLFAWWAYTNPRRIAELLTPGVIVLIPWFIFAVSYFGSLIPNSVAAKATSYNYPAGFGAYFFLTFLGTGTLGPYTRPLLTLAAAALSFGLLTMGSINLWRTRPAALLITQFPFIYGTAVIISNAPAYFPWYFQPLMPALIIAALAGVGHFFKDKLPAKLISKWSLAGLIVLVPTVLLQIHPSWPISRERESAYQDACAILQPLISEGTSVLAPDIGLIGWCLEEARIVDPIGLVSPEAIEYAQSLPPGQALSAAFIKASEPDYIVALEQYLPVPLREDPFLTANYASIWRTSLTITGDAQELYVFAKTEN